MIKTVQFPHVVVIPTNCQDLDTAFEFRDKLYMWCLNNLGRYTDTWIYDWGNAKNVSSHYLTFYFANQEDAVRFNLTHYA